MAKLANDDSSVLIRVTTRFIEISGKKVAIVLETKIYKIPIIENNVAFFKSIFTSKLNFRTFKQTKSQREAHIKSNLF